MSETQAIKPVPFINSSALKNSRFSNAGRLDEIFVHTGAFLKRNENEAMFARVRLEI